MGLSTDEVGLVFLFCSILYGVSSPIWGHVADKYNNHWSMMAVGLITSAVGLFVLAPLPWLPVNKEYDDAIVNVLFCAPKAENKNKKPVRRIRMKVGRRRTRPATTALLYSVAVP